MVDGGASLYLAIGTAIASAASGYVAYQGAQDQAAAQDRAAKYSAEVNQKQAEEERQTASENARRARITTQRRLASIRAKEGASGLVMSGSKIDSLAESASIFELQTGDVFRQGLARGAGYQQRANTALFEGQLMSNATRAGSTANLVSDLVSAGSAGYNVYRNY